MHAEAHQKHANHLQSMLQYFRESDLFLDTVIKCEDNDIEVHSVVIAAYSTVLHECLLHPAYQNIKKQNVILLDDLEVSYENMRCIINYMYTGNIPSIILANDTLQMKKAIDCLGIELYQNQDEQGNNSHILKSNTTYDDDKNDLACENKLPVKRRKMCRKKKNAQPQSDHKSKATDMNLSDERPSSEEENEEPTMEMWNSKEVNSLGIADLGESDILQKPDCAELDEFVISENQAPEVNNVIMEVVAEKDGGKENLKRTDRNKR